MAEDRFGDIRIDRGVPEKSKGEDKFLSRSGEKVQEDLAIEPETPAAAIEGSSAGYRRQSRARHREPVFSRKTAAWLSIIPLLAILYGVGSYFLVPIMIKGLLVRNFSDETGRPVEIGRIVFSPFTLELLADDVTIGAMRGAKTGGELLAVGKARFSFSLTRIFDGKFVCRQAVLEDISVNFVRQQETTFDLESISDLFFARSPGQDLRYWPAWLFLDELKITSGRIGIDDRQAEKVYSIEDIQFYLPSSEARNRDKAAIPKLTAVIDSSPFEINAVRFRNQSGAWRTGFSFAFNKLILNNFKELLPLPATGLHLTEGEADIDLNIILPEKQVGPQSIVIEGVAKLKDARWHDPDAQTKLLLPQARIVYRVVPAEKLFRLTNVEFHEPEIRLAGIKKQAPGEPPAFLAYLLAMVDKLYQGDEPLEVEDFLWNNGKMSIAREGAVQNLTVLDDVVVNIKGFSSSGHRQAHPGAADEPVRYTFRARDLAGKPAADFFIEGRLSTDSVLNGTLKITGLDLHRYPFLLPQSRLSLQEGIADISFHYQYARPSGGRDKSEVTAAPNKFFNGHFKTTGFVLGHRNLKAATGDTLTCRKFHVDFEPAAIVCDQLELVNSDIFAEPFFATDADRNSAAGKHQYLINNLQLSGSTIHAAWRDPAGTGKTGELVMRNVILDGKSLQAEKVADNIQASAEIGKKAKLTVSGSYSWLSGEGMLLIDLQEMELARLRPYFSSWFIPRINKGLFTARGNVRLPDKVFQGKISVDDLDAGEEGRARISWKRAVADNCTYRVPAAVLELNELAIQQPAVHPGLSNGEVPVQKYLRLKDDAPPSSLHISRIRFEEGEYELSEPVIYPGFQPLLQDISGSLALADASTFHFAVNGNIGEEGEFKLQGAGSVNGVDSYDLAVRDFSLRPFDAILLQEAGFSGQGTTASWNQRKFARENGAKVAARITVQEVVPGHDGPTANALALILDEDHRLTMEMEDEYSADQPQPFLLQQLVIRLRHQAVKALIAPQLVLKSSLPETELPERVSFDPGSAVRDGGVELSGYRELMQLRPFTALRLQGLYDPVADREALQEELQKEADRLRETENKRRALEKIKILQREKRRLEELKKGNTGIVAEEIPASELSGEHLQPLPRVLVEVDPSRLEDLARQRAKKVSDYLVNKLQLDPARIFSATDGMKGSSGVSINIVPHFPLTEEKE